MTHRETGMAIELLRAAERSLFDATVRLEEALAVMEPEDAIASSAVLAQARRWSAMIAAGLDRAQPATAQAPTQRAIPASSPHSFPGRPTAKA
jgi:hypothetical protein